MVRTRKVEFEVDGNFVPLIIPGSFAIDFLNCDLVVILTLCYLLKFENRARDFIYCNKSVCLAVPFSYLTNLINLHRLI